MANSSSKSSCCSTFSLPDLLPMPTRPAPKRSPASPNSTISPPPPFFFCVDGDDEEEEERLGAGFLDECGMCGRRMASGREAYMYGGEAAFCSEECRLEMMEMDEEEEGRRRRAAIRCVSVKRKAEVGEVKGGSGALVVG